MWWVIEEIKRDPEGFRDALTVGLVVGVAAALLMLALLLVLRAGTSCS